MRSRDVRATTAGLLFIAATATSLIATALLGSVLKGPGFLATVALHQDRLLTAALPRQLQHPLTGGFGRPPTRSGIQISRFGTTPGSHLGDQIADQ
jgi:hypothetical protein